MEKEGNQKRKLEISELNPDSDARPAKRGKHARDDVLSCDQCEFTTKKSSALKKHKEARHKGIRYPCPQYDYAATTIRNLTLHKKSKHEGIRCPCDQCEYTAGDP